ncbi:hypothetical protein IWW40_003033 [Coemansia sp. RSA 1250]|nr:hypothetical protein IWW40_003033 [Coemansia sp. RSA 1250]
MLAGQAEVVSASENGDVKYWDLRHAESAFTLSDTHPDQQLEYMVAHERAPIILTASSAAVKIWNRRGTNIGAVSANRNGTLNTTSYMKTLAGYGTARLQQPVRVAAAALHGYLPIALMVSDDGQISYIQPTKSGARPSNMTISSRSSSVYI